MDDIRLHIFTGYGCKPYTLQVSHSHIMDNALQSVKAKFRYPSELTTQFIYDSAVGKIMIDPELECHHFDGVLLYMVVDNIVLVPYGI